MAAPRVTVLMSVLNGEAFLAEAIDSVLAQTFGDFEFVIVDNASTDKTPEIIGSYDDARIVHIRNPETLNLSQSLNKGLEIAAGEYIARLDADDVAMPDRLAKQAAFLDKHANIGLIASAATEFGGEQPFPGKTPATLPPTGHYALTAALSENSIIAHSSIMYRRDTARDIGGYDEAYAYCMDYLLYFRLVARGHELACLPEPLVAIRVHHGQITHRPEWEARRHQEAASAFKRILAEGGQTARVQAGLRRYLILTSLRMTALAFRSAQPAKAVCWLSRAIAVGPVQFFAVGVSAAMRRVSRAWPHI